MMTSRLAHINNSAISLTIKTKAIANDALNMGDTDASFALDKKSDKPFTEKLDAETILGFIKSKTTLGELKQRGFEVTFVAPLYKNEESSKYKINNTETHHKEISIPDFVEQWIENYELKEAIKKLTDKERERLIEYFYKDKTLTEIGDKVGCSPRAVS